MTGDTLVRGARQLLTLRGPSGPRRGDALGDLGIIEDGALLIRGGTIREVGPSRRVENLAEARSAREIDASGKIVMPGFVDSHTHLIFCQPLLDGYKTRLSANNDYDRENPEALPRHARGFASTPSSRLQMWARRHLNALVRHGTTTIEVKSESGIDAGTDLKGLRVLMKLGNRPIDVVPTYLFGNCVPEAYRERTHEYLGYVGSTLLPIIRQRDLAAFVDLSLSRRQLSVDGARQYLQTAQGLGFMVKLHAEQFEHDGGTRLGIELGAISVDHLNSADSSDIEFLAHSNTIATLLPGTVFHSGRETYAPGRTLADSGAAIALASGFHPQTSPTYNMAMIISLAATRMQLTPAEAIVAATINGAHALRRATRAGSLEVGKDADLVIFNATDYRELAHYAGANLTHLTMKRGRVLYQEGAVDEGDD